MKGEGISLNKQNILFSICCNQKEAFQHVCVYERVNVCLCMCVLRSELVFFHLGQWIMDIKFEQIKHKQPYCD